MIHHGEQVLWQSVLQQALTDATSPNVESRDRKEAIAWITKPNANYDLVCELAGKCPIRFREAALKLIDHRQANPRRSFRSKLYSYNGKAHTLAEWSRITGFSIATIANRIESGWPIERALTAPIGQRGRQPNTITLTHDGKTLSLAEWAKLTDIKMNTLYARYNDGWSAERILTTPLQKRGQHQNRSKASHAWSHDRGRGVGPNFQQGVQTGGGSTARDFPEIEFRNQKELTE